MSRKASFPSSIWGEAIPWALLFASAFLLRTAADWLVPTADFHGRALASTVLGMAIFFLAGAWTSVRLGSLLSGMVIASATALIAVPMECLGIAALLPFRHDPATMAAIKGSGGLAEAFTLPFALVLPGCVVGAIGGGAGVLAKSLISPTVAPPAP